MSERMEPRRLLVVTDPADRRVAVGASVFMMDNRNLNTQLPSGQYRRHGVQPMQRITREHIAQGLAIVNAENYWQGRIYAGLVDPSAWREWAKAHDSALSDALALEAIALFKKCFGVNSARALRLLLDLYPATYDRFIQAVGKADRK